MGDLHVVAGTIPEGDRKRLHDQTIAAIRE
jgi:hypothetical protein